MKKIFLFFLLSIPGVIFSQNNFIKQITSGDFDARNPFVYKDEYAFNFPPIFFELHKDGYSNIYSVAYNANGVFFEDTVALTSGNSLKINPSFESNSGLLYQTNQNGNWDVVLIPNSNNTFGNAVFLTNSSEDEINPKYFESTKIFHDSTNILFKRQNDIVFLTYKNNQIQEDIIFQGSSGIRYTEFTGIEIEYGDIFDGYYVFAVEESESTKKIVRRFKPNNGIWQPQNTIIDNCNCSDISLQVSDYNIWGLFYQDTVQSNKRLFIIEDPISSSVSQLVYIDREGDISSFEMYSLLIVGKKFEKQNYNYDFYMPYTYLIENNGITKIRIDLSEFGFWNTDSLLQVSLSKPNLTVGPVGLDNSGMVVYTIWEDSIDGHIQLFGIPRHLGYGAVEYVSIANDFVLYQNYPNPFNPSTKIEYKLLQATDVKFNVFNILGEKVFEQNFGYQTAGSYKLNFDGSNLPSGVYVYSIYANGNRLSRKMLLMK